MLFFPGENIFHSQLVVAICQRLIGNVDLGCRPNPFMKWKGAALLERRPKGGVLERFCL